MKINCDSVINDIKQYDDFFFNTIFGDPPYNLGSEIYVDSNDGKLKMKSAKDFMGKWKFDHDEWEEFFKQSFRVLKYGGYCVLFGIDRQLSLPMYYAQLAGFEVCQSLYWYNISGFPKNLNVSKSIDKKGGKNLNWFGKWLRNWRIENNIAQIEISKLFPSKNGNITGCVSNWELGYNIPTCKEFNKICKKFNLPFEDIYELERIFLKKEKTNLTVYSKLGEKNTTGKISITRSNSELGKKYEGYHAGTTPFKPCLETIMVFHKPIKNKSYAEDILKYEEGNNNISPSIINIENSRVHYESEDDIIPQLRNDKRKVNGGNMYRGNSMNKSKTKAVIGGTVNGRYPSQLFIDDGCSELLDGQSGILKSGDYPNGFKGSNRDTPTVYGKYKNNLINKETVYADSGGCSRILHKCNYDELESNGGDLVYYNPKVNKYERNAGCDNLSKNQKTKKYEGCDSKCTVCGKYFLSSTNPCICDEKIHGKKSERMENPKVKNNHPTLKPMKLIYEISKLFKLPENINQKIYFPFSGAYSEIIGFLANNYQEENIYGCELDSDNIQIGEARLKFWKEHNFFFKEDKKVQNKIKGKIKKEQKNKKGVDSAFGF